MGGGAAAEALAAAARAVLRPASARTGGTYGAAGPVALGRSVVLASAAPGPSAPSAAPPGTGGKRNGGLSSRQSGGWK